MDLKLLDAYHIRARLSASIIILSPIVITLFLCFPEITSFASSSILIAVILAFTNYLPILQRMIYKDKYHTNYAAEFLMPNDSTIDIITKKRYYKKLAEADDSFSGLKAYIDSTNLNQSCELCHLCEKFKHNEEILKQSCNSAVKFLIEKTRSNHLVLEENINYGFYRNMCANKITGIVLCILFGGVAAVYSWFQYPTPSQIPVSNYVAFVFDALLLFFWFIGVKEKALEYTSQRYAKALLASIDSL